MDLNSNTNRYFYIDHHRNVRTTHDLLEWATQFEAADRKVAVTEFDEVMVSTVFLGIDHSFELNPAQPILFETMIFGGPLDQDQDRYATYNEALEGHDWAVQRALAHHTPFQRMWARLKQHTAPYWRPVQYKYWALRNTVRKWFK